MSCLPAMGLFVLLDDIPSEERTTTGLSARISAYARTVAPRQLRHELTVCAPFIILHCSDGAILLDTILRHHILHCDEVLPLERMTLLQYVLLYGAPTAFVTALLQNGASPHLTTPERTLSPLDMALRNVERIDALAEMLRLCPFVVDAPDLATGGTPLHRAVAALNHKACELLLAAGAALDVLDANGMMPMQYLFTDGPRWHLDSAKLKIARAFATHVEHLPQLTAQQLATKERARTALLLATKRTDVTIMLAFGPAVFSSDLFSYMQQQQALSLSDTESITLSPPSITEPVRVELVDDDAGQSAGQSADPALYAPLPFLVSTCDVCRQPSTIRYVGAVGGKQALLCNECLRRSIATPP